MGLPNVWSSDPPVRTMLLNSQLPARSWNTLESWRDALELETFWTLCKAIAWNFERYLQKFSLISCDFPRFSTILANFQRFWATCAILINFNRSWGTLGRSWGALGRLLDAIWKKYKKTKFFEGQLGPPNPPKLAQNQSKIDVKKNN